MARHGDRDRHHHGADDVSVEDGSDSPFDLGDDGGERKRAAEPDEREAAAVAAGYVRLSDGEGAAALASVTPGGPRFVAAGGYIVEEAEDYYVEEPAPRSGFVVELPESDSEDRDWVIVSEADFDDASDDGDDDRVPRQRQRQQPALQQRGRGTGAGDGDFADGDEGDDDNEEGGRAPADGGSESDSAAAGAAVSGSVLSGPAASALLSQNSRLRELVDAQTLAIAELEETAALNEEATTKLEGSLALLHGCRPSLVIAIWLQLPRTSMKRSSVVRRLRFRSFSTSFLYAPSLALCAVSQMGLCALAASD
jgi:hypothetical protein